MGKNKSRKNRSNNKPVSKIKKLLVPFGFAAVICLVVASVYYLTKATTSQMNAAANEAVGDLLLFLHADTFLDPAGYRKMSKVMSHGNLVGGAFSFQLDSDKTFLRVISRLATWRSRYFNLVYGDQAIFVRKDIFRETGGYPPPAHLRRP